MKKLMAVILMTVLILSGVPIVLADQINAPKPVKARTQTKIPKPVITNEGDIVIPEPMLVNIPVPTEAKAVGARKILGAKALVQTKNFEEIRQHQTEKLKLAIEKCREKGIAIKLCEKKFEKRVELMEKLKQKDLERIQKLEAKKMKTLKDIKEFKEKEDFAKFDKEFKAREVSKEKIQKARESFSKAKERFENSKERYAQTKQKFEAAKDKLQKCKEKEECEQNRNEIKIRVRESLLRAIDITDNKLIQIKEKISESEVLTEAEAIELISLIDEKLTETREIKLDLEAKEQLNSKELKEMTKKLRKSLQEITKTAKRASLKVMNSRIGGIIVKSKHLELKLERVLTKAAEKGINTDEAKQHLDQFEALLEEAKNEHESALELFRQGKIQDAQAAMKRAHKNLQQVHVVLKNIVSKLRNMNMGEELDEEDREVEIEQEIEEELIEEENEDEEEAE